MNIIYCGDQGIKDGLAVSILSLVKNCKSELNIYVLTINYQNSKPLSDQTIKTLDRIVKEKNTKSFVKKIHATDVFAADPPIKNMKSYFTPSSMLRLYIDKIPEIAKLDRVLYLDYDVVCRLDPTEFYESRLDGLEAAGVLDIYGKNFYHYNFPKTDYMNSGVLLFNMEECLKTDIFPRAVALCKKRRMMLADQAALNKVIKKRQLMPRRFNEQADKPKADTVFHHFSNNFKFLPVFHVQKVKPHQIDRVHQVLKITEYDDILKQYTEIRKDL